MALERSGELIWMRPEHAATGRPAPGPRAAGRPAQRSRAEITAAAVELADHEGLDAVSMRRLAAELGTGAASLYRYLDTREDLLDLMCDFTVAEFTFPAPTGEWLADLVGIGRQARTIMRRHPWLVTLVMTRPTLGPNSLAVLQHFLDILALHPAEITAKLEAFAMLNSVTAAFAQHELAGGSALQQRNVAYLAHAVTAGEYPRLAQLLAQAPTDPADPEDRYDGILSRILAGLLSSASAGT
jgi:AcrR family transcriptional regulator